VSITNPNPLKVGQTIPMWVLVAGYKDTSGGAPTIISEKKSILVFSKRFAWIEIPCPTITILVAAAIHYTTITTTTTNNNDRSNS
jgi:hypothetical protein